MSSPAPAVAWYPVATSARASWAQATGWKRLSGTFRQVSCVLPCRNDLCSLASLLPRLADALTDCGYPWEVLVVDSSSDDGTVDTLKHWCSRPGFRLAAFDSKVSRPTAAMFGLAEARGDAIFVLEPTESEAVDLLHAALNQWNEGAAFVQARRSATNSALTLVHSNAPAQLWPMVLQDGLDFAERMGGFVLIERQLVAALLKNL